MDAGGISFKSYFKTVSIPLQEGTRKWYRYRMDTKEPASFQINFSDQNCPARRALDLVTDKWTPLVVYLLHNGPQRYTQLKRQIGGITQKMLTQTLRKMEDEGLATRTVYPTAPPSVEYALTPLGKTLCEPLEELLQWARTDGLRMRSLFGPFLETNEEESSQDCKI
jgi:DNA-binding HxlR family transcriptional regulator